MNQLAAFLTMGAMFEADCKMTSFKSPVNADNVSGEIFTVIPKGCQRYTFDDGFTCVASSQKVADKKHYKFLKQV